MKYKTVFIDLDDTLIDTWENSITVLKIIYERHGINRYYKTFDDFRTVYCENSGRLWHKYNHGEISKYELLKGRFEEPFRPFEEATDEYLEEMNADYLDRVVAIGTHIAGAEEVLAYLKPKYQILILSNGFTEMQYKKIESTGLGKYFDKIILSDTVGVNKPHPDIFTHALKEAESSPSEAIMIGDNIFTDMTGAYRSGIDQIWYNPKNEKTADIQPTHVITHLVEIKGIL